MACCDSHTTPPKWSARGKDTARQIGHTHFGFYCNGLPTYMYLPKVRSTDMFYIEHAIYFVFARIGTELHTCRYSNSPLNTATEQTPRLSISSVDPCLSWQNRKASRDIASMTNWAWYQHKYQYVAIMQHLLAGC